MSASPNTNAPDSIIVHVTIESSSEGKKPRQLSVRVPSNAPSPVFEIKRALSQLKVDPVNVLNSRIKLIQNVDDITLPYSVLASTQRTARQENVPIFVAPVNERKDLQKKVLVDVNDTGIDLKFLLEKILLVPAEHLKLYLTKVGFASRVEIRDGDLLSKSGVVGNSLIHYMLEIPSNQVGHGAVHRTNINLTHFESPSIRDLGTVWLTSSKKFANKRLFGTRTFNKDGSRGPYSWITYAQAAVRVNNFGQGLRSLGLKKGDTVGIMSNNRTEWDICDFACSVQGFISVPLYDTLGPDAVEYIVNHASVGVVVTNFQSLGQIDRVKSKCNSLKFVVLMDDLAVDQKYISAGNKNFSHTFSGVEKLGSQNNFPTPQQTPDDIYTICYTSGTTGNPKGAVISHGNMVSASSAVNERMPPDLQTDNECMFSYLPLAHIYERLMHASLIPLGHAIGYSQGDNTKLVEDVAELKPSVFPGVPRVWQRIFDRVNGQLAEASFVSKSLFKSAYSGKLEQIKTSNVSPTFLGDKVVFPKIAAKFGGNVKFMVSGAAPLNSRVAEFMRIVCQTHFIEGYGLTETCGVLSAMSLSEGTYGVVGTPSGSVEVKLVDVPDMEYLSTDKPHPRGEIWCRGPNIFKGYFKQPDITSECFDKDGWFMTGDVGMWLPDGNLKIIDRKKNLFKLSQGEYIRPEYIESVYKQCPSIANIYVHGDSNQSCLVAIIVPDVEVLKSQLPDLKHKSLVEWSKDKKVYDFIFSAMNAAAKKEKLRGFEVVKYIFLASEEPTVENNLLTPSFKLKRHEMKKRYETQINQMYAQEADQPQITSKL